MAKARRNLAPLRKDNRTSNLPLVCNVSKCDCDFYVASGPVLTRKRLCEKHYNAPTPADLRKDATLSKLRSMGIC